MLEVKNVSYKVNNKIILDNINFELKEKETLVITGSNGSGKSTLLKVIMGLSSMSNGNIILDDEDISTLKINEKANKGLIYSYQTPVTFKGLTVFDLLLIANQDYPTYMEMKECLSSVGLNIREYLEREVSSSLSGGELKRIDLALALMKKGKVLMLDEPEAGIDLWSLDNLIKTIKNIKKNKEESLIIVTHQEKLLDIADKILVLDKGKVLDYGNKNDILKSIKNNKYSMEKKNG